MRRLVAGNWKMNGLRAEARERAAGIGTALSGAGLLGHTALDVAVFPPATALDAVRKALPREVVVGVQDVHAASHGAFTGSISAEMARDAGAAWAIVGHSERRRGLGETPATVAEKVVGARRAGLIPVLCVGEDAAERDAGREASIVVAQLDAVVGRVGPRDWNGWVIAYEPVWAIGTGRRAEPRQIAAMHATIRGWLDSAVGGADVRVAYGGSVTAANAAELFAIDGVDGALVGGASLQPAEFVSICAAAAAAGATGHNA